MENTQSKDTGGYGEKICEPCDDCYNLVSYFKHVYLDDYTNYIKKLKVSDAANDHRKNLASLDKLLQQIADNPEPVGEDFEMQLRKLQARYT